MVRCSQRYPRITRHAHFFVPPRFWPQCFTTSSCFSMVELFWESGTFEKVYICNCIIMYLYSSGHQHSQEPMEKKHDQPSTSWLDSFWTCQLLSHRRANVVPFFVVLSLYHHLVVWREKLKWVHFQYRSKIRKNSDKTCMKQQYT